jgi:hypothetical protein
MKNAARALCPGKIADLTVPENFQAAMARFPPCHQKFAPPILKRVAPFAAEEVKTIVKKLSNGASGGLTGWTKELLWAAIESDPANAEGTQVHLRQIFFFFFFLLEKMMAKGARRRRRLRRPGRPANRERSEPPASGRSSRRRRRASVAIIFSIKYRNCNFFSVE